MHPRVDAVATAGGQTEPMLFPHLRLDEEAVLAATMRVLAKEGLGLEVLIGVEGGVDRSLLAAVLKVDGHPAALILAIHASEAEVAVAVVSSLDPPGPPACSTAR